MWPGVATGVAVILPLATPLAVMVPGVKNAKKALANGHVTWLTTGSQVALTVGGTAFFV